MLGMQNVLIICIVYCMSFLISIECLGINWGTVASHKLPDKIVVQMLKDNGFTKVKLFDSDKSCLQALAGSGIDVMIAIPSGQIEKMNNRDRAKEWVHMNILDHNYNGGANITYVSVGNEPFLKSYNGVYLNTTFPALQNVQNALNEAGVGNTVKAIVPMSSDVYEIPAFKPVPSASRFRPDIKIQMNKILEFLNYSKSPFVVNFNPFYSLYTGKTGKPVLDKNLLYTNVFDANYDACVSALTDSGYENMTVMVGQIGWPTDGDKYANVKLADRFYKGLMNKLALHKGTPLRPGFIEVYLFSLLDEDAKSLALGNFERHWGIFTYDGRVKFHVDFTGLNKTLIPAQGVEYQPRNWCILNPKAKDLSKIQDYIKTACQAADCTSLGYGCSCNGLDLNGNASYAFNAYFQVNNQREFSCDFGGLGSITSQNISQGNCNFLIQLKDPSSNSGHPRAASLAWWLPVASPILALVTPLLWL